jgi:ribonuclease J
VNITIIISGGTIPGNEEDVNRMLNHLFARGANVIYGPLANVHVSGHGNREDIRVQPRFLIPVHGELRHLHLHARLAQTNGYKPEQIHILQNGSTWVTDGEKAWLGDPVPAEDVYVDGSLVGEINKHVMRDRERLSQDGFVIVTVPVTKQHKLAGEPRILSRGFLHMDSSEDLLKAARNAVKRDLARNRNSSSHKQIETIRETLQDFFYRETLSRPVILSNFVHV